MGALSETAVWRLLEDIRLAFRPLMALYRDDIAQLEVGMGMYDALFRWARDGFEEGHDWPVGRPQ